VPTSPASPTAEQLPARTAAVWAALDPVVGAGTPLRVLDVGGGSGMFAVPLAQLGHDVTVVDPSADALATLGRRAGTAGVGERVRGIQGDGDLLHEVLPTASGDGAVLARALSGHPVEALGLVGDREGDRRRFDPAGLLTLVEGAGLRPGPWHGVSVVADLLDAASGADPGAVRALELALAGISPYRDVAAGLHVLAARA
jgi:S-adenosylmethionine-dependent methyltransferase